MKRRAKILLGLILVAVVATGIWLLASRESGSKRAVDAYRQQLLAQGEKLAVSELVPIAPNGSFDNAQNLLQAVSMARPVTNGAPAMKYIAPGCALVAWQQDILPSAADKVSNIWPGLALELQANRGALTKLWAALDIPVLYFALDYSRGFGVLVPHLSKLKQAEVLTADAAVAALHENQYAEAWKNLQCAAWLVRIYQPEPLIISHLVRVADANIAMRAAWEFLQSDQWTDAQLAELQSNWETMEFFNAAEPAFLMEQAVNVEFFRAARNAPDQDTAFGLGLSTPANPPGFLESPVEWGKSLYSRWRFMTWKHSWSYDEELYSLQYVSATLNTFRQTQSTGEFAPAFKGLKNELAGIDGFHTKDRAHFLAMTIGDWVNTALIKFAEAETARRMTVTAIALRRYQLRHGNHPTELNALVPEFLREVPPDLMDGKALRYRRNSDGSYVLYSVGDDGEDNNGDPAPISTSNQTRNWLKGRDIVWPRPATAEEIAANLPAATSSRMLPGQTNARAGTDANGK